MKGKDTRHLGAAPAAIIAPVLALLAAGSALVPTLLGALPRSFGPYATLMMLGFVIGILGHLSRSRWLVTIGVILIFVGAFLLPLALLATTNDEPPPPPRVPAGLAG
jgi:sulfite exporter TauE/SafE